MGQYKLVNVFDTNFRPNTLTFVDQFLLIFWDGWSTSFVICPNIFRLYSLKKLIMYLMQVGN